MWVRLMVTQIAGQMEYGKRREEDYGDEQMGHRVIQSLFADPYQA
jgi:hypothetical protein